MQLDELWRSGVEARWEAALAEGSSGDLIPDLEALVAAAPLRERRWALLLSAYQRAGRRADGAPPSPATGPRRGRRSR